MRNDDEINTVLDNINGFLSGFNRDWNSKIWIYPVFVSQKSRFRPQSPVLDAKNMVLSGLIMGFVPFKRD